MQRQGFRSMQGKGGQTAENMVFYDNMDVLYAGGITNGQTDRN